METKLNFWQWLGIVLLLGGIVWYMLDKNKTETTPAQPAPSVPVAPATNPVITSQPSR